MKKTIALGAIALFSYSAFAQQPAPKEAKPARFRTKWGINAGATLANVNVSEGSAPSSIASLYLGGTVNMPIFRGLSLQSGLSLIGKGFNRLESQALSTAGKTVIGVENKSYRSTPWYLEMPINLITSLGAGPGRLLLGAGPYAAYGLFGKQELVTTQKALGNTTSVNSQITDITYVGTERTMNNWDFGLNFLMGYQLPNGFSVNLGYDLGLSNVKPGASNLQSVTNSVFSVGLGYSFR